MIEIIIASISAMAAFLTAIFTIYKLRQKPSTEYINDIETDLREEIADLRKALDEHTRRLRDCLREKDDLKQENYRLYKELSKAGA